MVHIIALFQVKQGFVAVCHWRFSSETQGLCLELQVHVVLDSLTEIYLKSSIWKHLNILKLNIQGLVRSQVQVNQPSTYFLALTHLLCIVC